MSTAVADEAFNRLKKCRRGRMLYNVNDAYIGRSLDVYGEFSEGEVELFQQIVRPGDVVIDAGANIGAHTLFFAHAVGRSGLVLAFEPQRLLFQTLCANVALNNLINVMTFNHALGETATTLRVPVLDPSVPQNFGALELGSETPAGEAVQVIRLDQLHLGACRLIKVDVEGMELAVLRGATGLIRATRPVLYVENDRPEMGGALVRFIACELGYSMYWHRVPLFNPQNFFGRRENVFGDVTSMNMVCVPPGVQIDGLRRVEAA